MLLNISICVLVLLNHIKCTKCFPLTWTHAQRCLCHSSIASSMTLRLKPCQTFVRHSVHEHCNCCLCFCPICVKKVGYDVIDGNIWPGIIVSDVAVVREFCRISVEFLRKGINAKVYQTASRKCLLRFSQSTSDCCVAL